VDEDLIGQHEIEELLKSAGGDEAPTEEAGGGDQLVSGDEIDSLLADAGAAAPSQTAAPPQPAAAPQAAVRDVGDDVQYLLDQAEEAIASANVPLADAESVGATQYQLQDFVGSQLSEDKATLDLLRDVELDLKIELGRTDMYLEDVLKLRKGSVVALDKLAGDPVDVYVNGRLIARGEVLVLNDNFCVRVAELIAGEEH
jgi:flagellar motor switch protein FliN/FliY